MMRLDAEDVPRAARLDERCREFELRQRRRAHGLDADACRPRAPDEVLDGRSVGGRQAVRNERARHHEVDFARIEARVLEREARGSRVALGRGHVVGRHAPLGGPLERIALVGQGVFGEQIVERTALGLRGKRREVARRSRRVRLLERLGERARPCVVATHLGRRPQAQPHDAGAVHSAPPKAA
jgi:hypothetical protein